MFTFYLSKRDLLIKFFVASVVRGSVQITSVIQQRWNASAFEATEAVKYFSQRISAPNRSEAVGFLVKVSLAASAN